MTALRYSWNLGVRLKHDNQFCELTEQQASTPQNSVGRTGKNSASVMLVLPTYTTSAMV